MYSIMKHSLLALSCLCFAVSALKLPLRQAKRDSHVLRRSTSAGQMVGILDNNDLIYLVNMTFAGQLYTMQLDTGSSDLWINTSGAVLGNISDLSINLTYGVGFAYGPIATVDVTFSGYDITSQAYLAAKEVNNPATGYGATGIVGIGHTRLSSIDMTVNQTGGDWGRSLLYNIFALNPSVPNYITMFLERANDPNEQVSGTFTIGEYDSQYEGIANTAPIPTYPPKNPDRWSVLVDGIVANGKKIPLTSSVKGVSSNAAVALLDSGTSLVYAPAPVVSAIYGGIAGAEYSTSLSQWILPCDAEADVSIVISGRQMDIHPLDTVQPTSSGSQTCIGSWLPQSLSVGQSEFDYIFGDAVLRSLYTLFNYGDFNPNGQLGDPYIKLWSLVNGSAASAEFHQLRGGTSQDTFLSNDNVNAASSNNNSSSNTSGSSPDISDLQTKVHNILKWAPVAIGVAALNVLVMLVVLIVSIAGCLRRRRNDRPIAPSGSFVPLPLGASAHNYQRVSLQEIPKYNTGVRYSD